MKKQIALLLSCLFILQLAACAKSGTQDAPNISRSGAAETTSLVAESSAGSDTTTAVNQAGNSTKSKITKQAPVTAKSTVKGTTGTAALPTQPPYYSSSGVQNRLQYNALTATQKGVYNRFCAAVENMTVKFNVGKINPDDLMIAYRAVDYDNPQYFWLPRSYTYITGDSTCDIEWEFSVTAAQRKSCESALGGVIREVLSGVSKYKTTYERQLYIHDYINNKVTYDFDALNNPNTADAYTAYAALIGKKAVCEGYSRAYQLLLSQIGIESSLISGKSKGMGHMWNTVKIDGKWYHNDLTWDDTGNNGYHTYFNVSEKFILADHEIDPILNASPNSMKDAFNLAVPVASAMDKNYAHVNATLISSAADIEAGLIRGFKNSAMKKTLVFEYSFSDGYDKRYNSNELKAYVSAAAKKYNASVAESQRLKGGYVLTGITGSKGFKVIYGK